MRINNEFVVHAPVERSWELLTDVESLVPCVPGVRLVGTDGDTHLAEARIKVGPAVVACHGTARLVEKDEGARRIVVEATGRSRRGEGTGSALITAGLRERGEDTVVSVTTDLELAGGLTRWTEPVLTEVAGGLMERCARRLDERAPGSGTDAAPAAPERGGAGVQRLWSAAALVVVAGGMLLGYLLFG
ncbi:SRPBCC domain-containing protein [Nocardiopsis changdeensis]|uniref:SRPBCC family protein n=1 Tax=Nocardiopsis changdeensis TaxID=2831969 RepID=A0ABX8BQF5_9ACTN|nr:MULTISPECIES: SRPBCC domain-containing protein [Nocardiopsis]QUX24324.1 SRPBCC family protein [Nocardiopsis changdeensis]QYX34715.1 SRPBCC family protein [Nocardiopsis sp. MT53]